MRELAPAGSSLREVIFTVNQLIRGRSNAVGSVTLDANQATTTVALASGNDNAEVILTPKTANAAAEIGNGTAYVSSITADQFVITHANNAQTDRTFSYAVYGG